MSRGGSVTKMSYIVTEGQTMSKPCFTMSKVCCTCDRGQFHIITQSLTKSVLIRFIEIEQVKVHNFVMGNSAQMHTVTEITK